MTTLIYVIRGVGKSGIDLARVNTYPWFINLSLDPRQVVLKSNLIKKNSDYPEMYIKTRVIKVDRTS